MHQSSLTRQRISIIVLRLLGPLAGLFSSVVYLQDRFGDRLLLFVMPVSFLCIAYLLCGCSSSSSITYMFSTVPLVLSSCVTVLFDSADLDLSLRCLILSYCLDLLEFKTSLIRLLRSVTSVLYLDIILDSASLLRNYSVSYVMCISISTFLCCNVFCFKVFVHIAFALPEYRTDIPLFAPVQV
jgi:hypothetical protein